MGGMQNCGIQPLLEGDFFVKESYEGVHRIPANTPITVSEYLRLLHNLAALLEMSKLG